MTQRSRHGLTILELLVVIAIITIIATFAPLDTRSLSNDAHNTATEIASTIRLTRARAVASTSAYRIIITSDTMIRAETNRSCSDTHGWREDASLRYETRHGARITTPHDTPTTIVCFNSRGLGNNDPTITIHDRRDRSATIDVLAGGTVTIELHHN